jgi:TP901 family phage tail tape measure protein
VAGGRIDILVEPDTRGFGSKLGQSLSGIGSIAGTVGKGIGLAVAAGTAIAGVGLKQVIDLGIQYTGKLNEMQAVTGATALQMAQIGQTAKALGADLTLPATSAAGAADAMLELAKGGLSVDQAMKAAKGTLQLAAAAQIDGASAAEIQSNALNQFGLSAESATHVADVLANTANAASGSIGDIALALKYVGPVAKSVGVSIDDTATAIGLLANKGIQADQAGTSLRAMIAGLAAPSKPAAKALKELGVNAFDSSGKFVGFRTVIDQLAKAQGRMTQEQFASASATAFGREPLAAIVALASSGAPAFDEMAQAVSRQGGAADVAAAKMKGLGGAWEGFKSQLETAGISIFESIDGPLEGIVRKGSDLVEKFTPAVKRGLDGAISSAQLFGPELAKALESRASALADVAGRLVKPLLTGIKETISSGVTIATDSIKSFADIVRTGVDVVEPLAHAVGHVVESFNQAGGPIGAFGAALGIAYGIVKGIVTVVGPVVGVVADLVSAFGDLPGPIQTAAVALLALKVGPSILSGLKSAVSGTGKEAGDAAEKTGLFGRAIGLVSAPVKLVASGMSSAVGTFRQFSSEMAVQRGLASQSGSEMGRLGASVQALHTSTIPAIATVRGFAKQVGQIKAGAAGAGQPISTMSAAIGTLVERSSTLSSARDAFNTASEGAERFGRTAGTAAAAGSLLKSAGSGIMGALGGPFGIVLGVATLGLGLLASAQEEAAKKAEEHKRDVSTLAGALRESGGAIDDHIRKLQAEQLQTSGTADKFQEMGISLTDLTAATLKQSSAYDDLHAKLEAIVKANSLGQDVDPESGNVTEVFNERGKAAQELLKTLEDFGGKTDEAQRKQKDLDAAIKNGTASMLDATESGRSFADAMHTLSDRTASADDKARALKNALDSLSGGQVSLDEATAKVNEQFDRLNEKFGENVDKTKGWGDGLLTSAGRINTVTENGRALRDSLDEITTSTVDVAQRTFEMTGSLDQAKQVVQDNRDRFIGMAQQMGISATQAGALADQMGLIPEQVATLITMPGMTQSQSEILYFQGLLARTPPGKDVVIRSLTAEAEANLVSFGFKVTHMPDGSVSVHAQTSDAQQKLDAFVAQQRTINVTVRYTGVINKPSSLAPNVPFASGGFFRAYADGGMERLRPMKGGLASIVGPNTWRVIGDRAVNDEAYIPINRSSRSVGILQETADRMGFALLRRFASGGIAVSGGQTVTTGPATGPSITNNVSVRDNDDAYTSAKVLSQTLAFQLRVPQ